MSNQNHQQQIDDLNKSIAAKEKELESLRVDYRQAIRNLALSATNVISIIIGGSIFGIRVARLRREIRVLSAQVDELTYKLENLQRAQAALARMHGLFGELSDSLGEVSTSLEDLQISWSYLQRFLVAAHTDLGGISDANELLINILILDDAVKSWREASQIAGLLEYTLSQGATLHRNLRAQGHRRVPVLEPEIASSLSAYLSPATSLKSRTKEGKE